jgi:hypothetical protein
VTINLAGWLQPSFLTFLRDASLLAIRRHVSEEWPSDYAVGRMVGLLQAVVVCSAVFFKRALILVSGIDAPASVPVRPPACRPPAARAGALERKTAPSADLRLLTAEIHFQTSRAFSTEPGHGGWPRTGLRWSASSARSAAMPVPADFSSSPRRIRHCPNPPPPPPLPACPARRSEAIFLVGPTTGRDKLL